MPESSFDFSSDFIGRIRNISLAPSPNNALAPVFEAITNALQAVEEKFGPDNIADGKVEVEVLRDPNEGNPVGFKIRDNGIGLTEANFSAFRTSDTRHKIAKGGKGVGRFLWLKVFSKASVVSRFNQDGGIYKRSFLFVAAEDKQIRDVALSLDRESAETGTEVELSPFRSEYEAQCPKKRTTIRNRIIGHFLSIILSENTPSIYLIDGGKTYDLKSELEGNTFREEKYVITIGPEDAASISLRARLLPKDLSDDEKGTNGVFYVADGRTVKRHDLDGALGLKQIKGRYAFFGLVEGDVMNDYVNQERTDFSWPDELFESMHRSVIESAKEFLSPEIEEIRQRQAAVVEKVRSEHLRFLSIARDARSFAEGLSLSVQSAEDVFLELSRASVRQYNRKKRQFNESNSRRLPDFDAQAKAFTQELEQESLSSLAEYVYKRKLILDVLDDRMSYRDKSREDYHVEEAVHELICPLRRSSSTLAYRDHNLWIIDDNLAFYTYFSSDQTVKKMTGGESDSTSETDLAIFDLGLGFEQRGSTNPVSIIEFKRPGRDNYTLADNPFTQIRDYVRKLRNAGVAKNEDGQELRTIEENTPFLGYVIADTTPTLREMMIQFGPFHRKAGHGSYYKWDESFRIFIEVSSYAEILKSARARHEAFFERLRIKP